MRATDREGRPGAAGTLAESGTAKDELLAARARVARAATALLAKAEAAPMTAQTMATAARNSEQAAATVAPAALGPATPSKQCRCTQPHTQRSQERASFARRERSGMPHKMPAGHRSRIQ